MPINNHVFLHCVFRWLITQFTHRVLLPVIFHLMINLFTRLNVYSFSIHVLLFCFNLKTCFIKKASTAAALSSDWPDCCQHVAAEHSELFFSYQLIKWLWWNTSNAFNHSGGTLRAHYAQLFTHFCITVGTQQLLAKSLCDHWHGEVIQTTSLPPTITWFCVNLLLSSGFTALQRPPAGKIRGELLHCLAHFTSTISQCTTVQLHHLLYLLDKEKCWSHLFAHGLCFKYKYKRVSGCEGGSFQSKV